MTDYQKAELKMLQGVVNFFNQNPELEKNNKILKKHLDLVREKITEIKENELKQGFNNTGYTENKKEVKNELADLDINITASICSFATDTGKNELYQEFNKPISRVQTMSDIDIVNYSNTIVAESQKYKDELEPYNVTADELVNLTKLIDDYSAILLIPAQERKEKKVATENIKNLISETLIILSRSLDNDMIHYKDTEADLYETYLNIREIDDSKTTALSIKGKVTDAHFPDQPVQYVQVTVKFKPGSELSGNVKSSYTTTTTKLGNFQFKGLPEGSCRVKFERNNYRTLELNSEVHHDKFTKLDVLFAKEEV